MNLVLDGIEMMLKKKEALAAFGRPADERLTYSREGGFSTARNLAEGCMGWTWCQWLMGVSNLETRKVVEPFVYRGMEIQDRMPNQHMRGLHDLFLLHCAIFASTEQQLRQLAERAVDASGAKGESPRNDGDLYASAWSGMLKHWILDDKEEAVKQSKMIWGAYRPPYFRATSKPIVTKWLEEDWDAFVKEQKKDFEKLWNRARKDGTVTSEKKGAITVNVERFPIAQLWCWAHCGLALLAHRKHIQIATDPFWLPMS